MANIWSGSAQTSRTTMFCGNAAPLPYMLCSGSLEEFLFFAPPPPLPEVAATTARTTTPQTQTE